MTSVYFFVENISVYFFFLFEDALPATLLPTQLKCSLLHYTREKLLPNVYWIRRSKRKTCSCFAVRFAKNKSCGKPTCWFGNIVLQWYFSLCSLKCVWNTRTGIIYSIHSVRHVGLGLYTLTGIIYSIHSVCHVSQGSKVDAGLHWEETQGGLRTGVEVKTL